MPLTILGIDPGSRHLGWGLVRAEGTRLIHLAHGVLDLSTELPLGDRLVELDEGLHEVIETHQPHAGSVESIFFAKDAQAAAKLGHARGVILLALRRANLPFGEYAPTQVKRAIVGRGLADKKQVAMVVSALLSLKKVPRSDAADALALAITHARNLGLQQAMARAQRR
jgi:crossover junction endodeoxyribonuclease RuvC